MKKLILAVLTLASLSSYASPQFNDTTDLAERYVISYEKDGKLSRENTKTIINLFAKEAREEINRVVGQIGKNSSQSISRGQMVYSRSASLLDKIEKKFPAKKNSEMTQLGDEMAEVCKQENTPVHNSKDKTPKARLALVEELCNLSGRAVKYIRKSNF